MNQEQKDILNSYAELKKEIKFLEEKADTLNPQVLQIMEDSGAEEIDINDIGKISLGSRRTWKYTNKVKELETQLKDQKSYEERTGDATYVEKNYPIFKALKEG